MSEAGLSERVWSLGAQALGRSDFVRMLYGGSGIPESIAAELVGLVARPEAPERIVVPESAQVLESAELPAQMAVPKVALEPPPTLWRAIGPVVKVGEELPRDSAPDWLKSGERLTRLGSTGQKLPEQEPLLPPARLGCVLRQHLRAKKRSNRLDLERLVAELSRCRALRQLPKVMQLAWPERLQLYWDSSAAMALAHSDQRRVYRWLERWRGKQGLELIFVKGASRRRWKNGDWCPVPVPDLQTKILALSDLGAVDGNRQRMELWSGVRCEAQRQGATAIAFVLCPSRRWQKAVIQGWHALDWERARPLRRRAAEPHSIEQEQTLGQKLVTLLSPLLRIEPALLREARKLLRAEGADLGTELDAWLSPHVERRSRDGIALDPLARQELHSEFMQQPAELREDIEKLIEIHHAALSPLILAEELLACESITATERARRILTAYARRLQASGIGSDSELLYMERLTERQPKSAWQNELLTAVWGLANRNAARDGFQQPLPEGMTLSDVLWTLTREQQPRWARIWQQGNVLRFQPSARLDSPKTKGHLADLPLRTGLLQLRWQGPDESAAPETSAAWILDVDRDEQVELPAQESRNLLLESDMASLEIAPESRPPWAKSLRRARQGLLVRTDIVEFEWREAPVAEPPKPALLGRVIGGAAAPAPEPHAPHIERAIHPLELLWPPWAQKLDHDRYGLVATLELAPNVLTRLRWVPPGRYLMGSPSGENGRFDQEGPQHWVELSFGLWLAETPCTQGQWEAVMGSNPSHFTGEEKRPVEQVSWEDCQEFCKALNARCPSLGARLPTEAEWEYACRAGTGSAYNDGSACTQPEGHDPGLEKLAWFGANSEGTTHPVKEKQPNAWGLYDLHGNVWECCRDWYGPYAAQEQRDPVGPAEGQDRVFRGGSWSLRARHCRSAYRRHSPGDRWDDQGFRLAAVQWGEPGKGSNRP
jgi:formylglycine-generating enzyme required for sulfatase activity